MNINWKQIGWRTLQLLILLIINGATIAYFVMKMVGVGDIDPIDLPILDKPLEIDYWYVLPMRFKIMVYCLMLLGVLCSIGFVKLLYKNHREDKANKKQEELENKKQENFTKTIEKIMEGKK